jgi:hypothetical protein
MSVLLRPEKNFSSFVLDLIGGSMAVAASIFIGDLAKGPAKVYKMSRMVSPVKKVAIQSVNNALVYFAVCFVKDSVYCHLLSVGFKNVINYAILDRIIYVKVIREESLCNQSFVLLIF